MTCIVGIVARDGTVWMGGDRAGVDGTSLDIRCQPKVFRNGAFLMGFTTSFRMGQLLQHVFAPPLWEGGDLMSYMVREFVEELRSCLREGGVSKVDNAVESGGTFLVGTGGRLFSIHDDFQVCERDCRFDACGAGRDLALGAVEVLREVENRRGREDPDHDTDWHQMVIDALLVAHRFSTAVRGEYDVLSIGPEVAP